MDQVRRPALLFIEDIEPFVMEVQTGQDKLRGEPGVHGDVELQDLDPLGLGGLDHTADEVALLAVKVEHMGVQVRGRNTVWGQTGRRLSRRLLVGQVLGVEASEGLVQLVERREGPPLPELAREEAVCAPLRFHGSTARGGGRSTGIMRRLSKKMSSPLRKPRPLPAAVKAKALSSVKTSALG